MKFFTPDRKPVKGRGVSEVEFIKYMADMDELLFVFKQDLVALWLGKDTANFSKKMSGTDPITRNDIKDLYGKLSSVIRKLADGVLPYQIELEMSPVEEPEGYKNLYEEMRLIKADLAQKEGEIRNLEAMVQELLAEVKKLRDEVKKLRDGKPGDGNGEKGPQSA